MQKTDLRCDPELRALLPPLSTEEKSRLRENLKADGGALDPLIVWQLEGRQILVDGYHRLEICGEEGLPYRIEARKFDGKADVIAWILDHQAGRRNLTPHQLSMIRAAVFEAEKNGSESPPENGSPKEGVGISPTKTLVDRSSPPNKTSRKAEQAAAKKTGVTRSTIRSDVEYKAAFNGLANDIQRAIDGKEIKASKKEVIALAQLQIGDQRKAVKSVKAGEAKCIADALKPTAAPETEPAEAEATPVDAWGVPIQKHAAPAFEAVEKFDELLTLLRRADRLYSDLAETPGGAYLLRPGVSINARDRYKHKGIKDAIAALEDCKPTYTVCPRAYHAVVFPESKHKHGKDCQLCHGLNWSRALVKNEVDEKVVAKIKETFDVQS